MTFTPEDLYRTVEATWPPARAYAQGPVTLREGQGGGSRVSAATVEGAFAEADIDAAEAAMAEMGQPRLFMIRHSDGALDAALAARGYIIKDPVVGYAGRSADVAAAPPPVTTFEAWPPLATQREIWADGGIGPARLAVMARAEGPKVAILGRLDDAPAGTAFVAAHAGAAMIHAVEVTPRFRRRGLGRHMMQAAARWAAGEGIEVFSLVVTEANAGARALYDSLGLTPVGHYHYRIKPDEAP